MSVPANLAKIPSGINAAAVRIIRAREERRSLILEGLLPRTSELLAGYPFAGDSIERDIRLWTNGKILLGVNDRLRAALENLAVSPTMESCKIVGEIENGELDIDETRVRIYAACLGDHDALRGLREEVRFNSLSTAPTTFAHLTQIAMADGLVRMIESMEDAYDRGYSQLERVNRIYGEYIKAARWHADGELSEEAEAAAEREIAAIINEDRAETAGATTGGLLVVPALAMASSSHKRDIQKPWSGIAGAPIALVARGNVAEQRDGLVSRWPHAAEIIDTIMSDLSMTETVHFKPTILVGRPGSGKTTLVRAIAERCSLPVEIIALGGVMDSSLMGTSAQWSTARESIPLQLIRKSKIANPAVIWDEIEKASHSSHNGSPLDALLPMLERNQSRAVYDLALETEVDLSAVSHFATCNSLEGIPAPLRDRMRILRMPDPSWQHIGSLAENIVTDLMLSRGLDGRWVAPLAPDEMDVIKRAWSGGSLRQLTRIVETLVDGREQLWGRA